LDIRSTGPEDIAAVDALLARSYPALLKDDYDPRLLEVALPLISRAQPELVTCGTYFCVFVAGALVSAGGWTQASPSGDVRVGCGHIRHVVTDPSATRQGYGRALMAHIETTAAQSGIEILQCQATLTAEPFYAACGFERVEPIEVELPGSVAFPATMMRRELGF